MKRLLTLVSISLLFSCDNTSTKTPTTSPTPTNSAVVTAISFKDVKTIIDQKCTTCHTSVGRTPAGTISFDTISVIGDRANQIKKSVTRRSMPPSGSLPPNEMQLISDWADQGGKTE